MLTLESRCTPMFGICRLPSNGQWNPSLIYRLVQGSSDVIYWFHCSVHFLTLKRIESKKWFEKVSYLYINLACLFVSNKRQNGWTDQAQILCGTSRGLSLIRPRFIYIFFTLWFYEYGIPVIYSLVFLLSGLNLYIFYTL